MASSVLTRTAEAAPTQSAETIQLETIPDRQSERMFAIGALTVSLSDDEDSPSERHDFASGAYGITNVEIAFGGEVDDTMMTFAVNRLHPLLKGNALFVPDNTLYETQKEVAQRQRRQSAGTEISELALARMLYGQPIRGASREEAATQYDGLLRIWDDEVTYASVRASGITVMTFNLSPTAE